jgi:hypothetical protein
MLTRPTSPGRSAPFRKLAKLITELLWRIRMSMAERRARWREPRLFNAAYKQPAWQSSTSGRKRIHGARRATRGRAGGRAFSLTKAGARPWWMVELQADWPIHSIRIHGRRGRTKLAAKCLQVSVSPDRERWEVIYRGRYILGDMASPGPLVIRLLDTSGGRFVKLELPDGGDLALSQVEVMVAVPHLALKRTADRYGFVFEQMTSLRMRRHVKPYSMENVPKNFDGEIQALHIARMQGRFGNNLHQIGNAICVARRLGISRIYVTKLSMLEVGQPIPLGDVTLLPESELRRDRPQAILAGTFFYGGVLRGVFDRTTYGEVASAARIAGQRMLRRMALPPALAPGATDLEIHLRAGDIFRFKEPDSNYVQPPLAFYQLCIDFARARLGIERAILVYEDEGNPCIAALKSWLDQIGFPYVAETRSFEEDLAIMLAASHCVFGRGTLGRAVTMLSDTMQTVFYTWLERHFDSLSRHLGIRGVSVEDAAGRYIKRGDWHNTPEQRQAMLDYPIENLRLRSD